jgi:hypothetical protein
MTTPVKSDIDPLLERFGDVRVENNEYETTVINPKSQESFTAVSSHWSPPIERLRRNQAENGFKVRSTRNNTVPIMGGDWIRQRPWHSPSKGRKERQTATSVRAHRWTYCPSHWCSRLCFQLGWDWPTNWKLYNQKDWEGCLHLFFSTDSLVFEFHNHILVEPYKINLGGASPHSQVIPNWAEVQNSCPLQTGALVIAYGANPPVSLCVWFGTKSTCEKNKGSHD